MLDVRKPIGWLFTVYGAILVVFGLLQPHISTIEGTSLSFDLNAMWGAAMGVFGLGMLALAALDKKAS